MTDILFESLDNPLPEVSVAGFLKTEDGLDLRYALFRPVGMETRGTIILAQGRNESIEKYSETIRELNAANYWVATFDWRGQGGSSRLLANRRAGYVARFEDYERDLEFFIDKIVRPHNKLPLYIVAHSMGALVVLSSILQLSEIIEKVAISAPFVGLAGKPPMPQVARLVARLACMFGLGTRPASSDEPQDRFSGNDLTSDARRFERNTALVKTHPALGLGPPTWHWLDECLHAIGKVMSPKHLSKITLPTLILGATKDRVASFEAAEKMSRGITTGRLVPIEGAEHELFQESDAYRAEVMEEVLSFLGDSAPPMKP